MSDAKERLEKQLAFIRELDRLKTVKRRTYLLDESRTENSAEHSWHASLMALLLLEHASESGLDAFRVARLLSRTAYQRCPQNLLSRTFVLSYAVP